MPGCFCYGTDNEDSGACETEPNRGACAGAGCNSATSNTKACLNVDNAHDFLFGL
jgi:hypothetical protein